MRSDGSQNNCLTLGYQPQEQVLTPEISVSQGHYGTIAMNGPEVYKFAVKKVPEAVEKALFRSGLTTEDVDWLLLHQANQRILDAVAKRLKIPAEKVLTNLSKYGNTSAASIPLALNEPCDRNKSSPATPLPPQGLGPG